ncbi:SDR family NAD(P)-dependent oxidoreductase [Spirosoma daeguense]
MMLTNKTILITGGSSGIGLEAARQLLAEGASVIITGRNSDKLDEARRLYPALITIQSDASSETEARSLLQHVDQLGGIDILYNNAGVGSNLLNLGIADERHVDNAANEIAINYLAVVRLNNLFLPMLNSRPQATIINTTSLLRYVPSIVEPTYSASKAALGFYTESLRTHLRLSGSRIQVVELLPPLVATGMTAGRDDTMLTPEAFVRSFIRSLKKDKLTIRVGDTRVIYLLNRLFPRLTYQLVNPKKSYSLLQAQR